MNSSDTDGIAISVNSMTGNTISITSIVSASDLIVRNRLRMLQMIVASMKMIVTHSTQQINSIR